MKIYYYFIVFLLIILSACKKETTENAATFSNIEISEISSLDANFTAEIVNYEEVSPSETGFCWATTQNPSISDNKLIANTTNGIFSIKIENLMPDTKYYVKAYCISNAKTYYSSEQNFTTLSGSDIQFNPNISYGTLTDIDGNTYKTVTIDDKTWMAENLKVTHYNNGDPINEIQEDNQWNNNTEGAFCKYQNNSDFVATYGLLYNWYAVSDTRNIAPEGWHVATAEELLQLSDFLNGDTNAGGKLKETGTLHWKSPNTGAENSSGFTALPGGIRYDDGSFNNKSWNAYFWSASPKTSSTAWYRVLYSDNSDFDLKYSAYNFGLSVRCVKN